MKKNNGYEPFSIESKIKNKENSKIFHWHPSQNNLIIGIKKIGEFVSKNLKIENNNHEPFSFESIIKDEKGHKIFHCPPSQNNLVIGMMKTGEFVSVKLGIEDNSIEEHWMSKRTKKEVDTIVEKVFGVRNENEKK